MEMKTRPPMKGRKVGTEWLFIPIAKNAHRSVVRAILDSPNDGGVVYWNNVPKDLKTIVLMREPLDRLWSTYRMFREHWGTELPIPSFNYFVGSLLRGVAVNHPRMTVTPDDMHLLTQWDSMGGVMPDVLVKWDIDKLCSILDLELPHIGRSDDVVEEKLNAETQILFENYYRKDLEIWNGNT